METKDEDKIISVRFPTPLWIKLKDGAATEHRSFNSYVKHLLFKAVENEEIEQAVLREFRATPTEEPGAEGREINGTDGIDNP